MAEPNELNANQNNQDGQDSQFDIHFLLNTLWRLRFWMIASVAVCLCVAFFYLKTKTDTYASQMMILITTDKNAGMSNSAQMSFIQDMTGFSSFNSLENEKVIIRSTPVVQKVVEEQELNVRYYVEHTFRNEETMCEEISMTYIPSPAYNVNRLPHIRIDYDIIGVSYYPYFKGPLANLDKGLTQLEQNFPGKRIQLVETGYPSKWAVEGSTYDYSGSYPYSHEGQRQFTADLIATLKKHPRVNGLSWWYAEANANGCTGSLKSGWYNASLFDNETGRALPALYEMKNFK